MKLINPMHKPDLPGTMLFQPSGLIDFPSSVEVFDALSATGSGVGIGSNSIKSAMGEYFERRHFYREILSTRRGVLNESLTDAEVDSFTGAFVQTACNGVSIAALESYQFFVSEVVRASDFSSCFIPTVCLSLSSRGLESDTFICPKRDTCGCSFHWRSEVAFLGALKEYLERQFLLRFWLTKKCRSLISPLYVDSSLVGRRVIHLYHALLAAGKLSVFDISDSKFPGVCILVVYGQNRPHHNVNYCAGMSYASTEAEALEKALLELWQTYRFIDLFGAVDSDIGKVEDPYLRYFLSCNSFETYHEITDVLVVEESLVSRSAGFTLQGLLSVLKGLGVAGYFYSKYSTVNGVGCLFCRYLSPDLFLHMDNSGNINLINKYSKSFLASVLPSRLERMVPFP